MLPETEIETHIKYKPEKFNLINFVSNSPTVENNSIICIHSNISFHHLVLFLLIIKLEDKFWPPAAVVVNVQSLLHANSK